jgi:hypothetical protein
MHLFTNVQTESWQRDIIAGAAKVNDLASLCWFVQMVMPPPSKALAKSMTQQERIDHRYRTACAPRDWIPYVKMGNDPATSRIRAELLTMFFIADNDPAIRFYPALALTKDVRGKKCYEFLEMTWDHVCSRCGSVFVSTDPDEVAICRGCNYHFYRMAML